MRVPHPIPYQGSKRALADMIISYVPGRAARLIEPFAGSAALSLAAAQQHRATGFVLNDANEPLIDLWEMIITHPEVIAEQYRRLWEEQKGQEREYYDTIRDKFNQTRRPDFLLYLLARCVKASVRYNAQGEFNQSPDNRRCGTLPATMRHHIVRASHLLQEKTVLLRGDYRSALVCANEDDIIYMDPPYQGVCGRRNPRYSNHLEFDAFVETLHLLNQRRLQYIISYDGRTGDKRYGQLLPNNLNLQYVEIHAGRSTQATLLSRSDVTYEALYLSPSLASRLSYISGEIVESRVSQPSLFAFNP